MRKDSAKALDRLPTYLSLAIQELRLNDPNRDPVQILEERIQSMSEELKGFDSMLDAMNGWKDHIESQRARVYQNHEMYSSALSTYLQLLKGKGAEDELWAFDIIFKK